MAEDSNLKLIKRVTKDWVTGQYDDIMPFVDDKAQYVIARGSLERVSDLFGTFTGKAKIRKWYDLNKQVIHSGGIHPFCTPANLGKFMAVGNKVVSYGSLPRSGTAPANDWVAIWTLRRNKIIHCWLVMDTATAFVKLRRANPRLALR
jgi:hypothetical protein